MTAERISALRDELALKKAAGLSSCPMYFDDYAELLTAAEEAGRLREALTQIAQRARSREDMQKLAHDALEGKA